MSNSQTTYEEALHYTFIVSIPVNMVGLGMIVWKIRKIKDPKINKTYSRISIWMLYQLLFVAVLMIITLPATIYADETIKLLGKYDVYLKIVTNFIITI